MKRAFLALFCLTASAFFAAGAEAVDYLRDIKPILAKSCYKCHGAQEQKAGLRLDTARFALSGGDSGPSLIPGKGSESLLVQSVKGTVPEMKRMPLKMPALSDGQIALIERWIDHGAKAPADEQPESLYAAAANHWAFKAPQRPALPAVSNESWIRNPIDRFVLARLEKEGIQPSTEADRVTLLRRLKLDLIGLPPTVEEVKAFTADNRADAYERWVERFLDSPHYGERWGRHWLDIARYADSNGYSIDAPRSIWKYRDWVIDAFNRDLPFDRFAIEQLAGDMLPNATMEQKIATGFHRNTQINQEGGIDKEQFRIESIFDRVDVTSTAFLGLTVACAQCHDHKFDPISQREYYQLFAFLNNADEPTLELPSPEEAAKRDTHREQVRKLEKELKDYADARKAAQPDWTAKGDAEYGKRQAQITKLKREEPKVTTTLVMQELAKPRETHLFIKGDFTRPDAKVSPGTPAILHPLEKEETPNRLDLARWLVDKDNPLVARVTVNRIWQAYFGRGIVETANDFGTQGLAPTHPDLLDWLATEFMARNWSQKAVHRLIVTSAAYRQSSNIRPDLQTIDPDNRLLARQNRLRLDAEIVRDVALGASGLLTPKVGGPSVFPPIPDGVMSLGQVKREWKADTDEDRYRRGMYTFFYRATPHPALAVFDAPDAFSTCTRRPRSNTPLQALTLLNDQGFFEMAQGLARRVLKEAPSNDAARLDHAFRLCLSRIPKEYERQRLMELLELEKTEGETAAWTTIARVLLNLDETITRE